MGDLTLRELVARVPLAPHELRLFLFNDGAARDAPALPLVGEGGHALHAEAVDHEHFAGVLFDEFAVNAGGDEQAIQIRAAKGAGSRLNAGEVDLAELFTRGWVEANYAAAVAEGHPEVAVGVDSHAIGRTVVAVPSGVDGDRGMTDCSACVVVIIGADLLSHRVDVIHFGGSRIPANAVRISDLVDFEVERTVGIEHIECGVADVFDEADGACPEAASGIAFAIVKAISRTLLGLWIG